MAARGIETVSVETANYSAPDGRRQAEESWAASWMRCTLVVFARSRGTCRGTSSIPLDIRRVSRDAVVQDADRRRLRRDRAQHRGLHRSGTPRLRSQRAVCADPRGADGLRGRMPLAIVPIDPRALERRPSRWPRFPWAGLWPKEGRRDRPDDYTGSPSEGFEATYGYVTRSASARSASSRVTPEVPIHVAGGVVDPHGWRGARGVRRGRGGRRRRRSASASTTGTTMTSTRLARDRPPQVFVGHAARSRSRDSSRCSGSTFTSASTGMKFVSPDQRGTTCRCTWSAMPAPAARPRFQPRLKPSGCVECRERLEAADGEPMERERLLGGQLAE